MNTTLNNAIYGHEGGDGLTIMLTIVLTLLAICIVPAFDDEE
jgi:hypothetical protein